MAKKTKSAKARAERSKVSARETAAENNKGFTAAHLKLPSGVRMFSFKKAGAYRIDVMSFIANKSNPGAKGKDGVIYFTRRYFAHRGVGANNDMVVCPKMTIGQKCPICEARAKLLKDPDADEEVITSLAPKKRNLFLVRDVGAKSDDPTETMVLDISDFLFPKQLFEKIDNADPDDDDESRYEFFADPEDGSTLKLIASEESFNGQAFRKVSDIEFKPRKQAYDPEIVEEMPCLDDMLIIEPYAKLKSIFLENDDIEDEDDEDDEDAPAKGKAKGKAKSKAKPKDEDDEDEDDEPPVKSKGKAKAKGFAIGDTVKHKKLGECEVVHVSENGSILRLEDEDGELHRGIKSSDCVVAEASSDDDEDEDDEPPVKSKSKSKSKAPAKDDEDEDDEDEPPAKAKGKSKAKPKGKAKPKDEDDEDEDDEDEDEDDEDEDEDDEVPAKSKGKAKAKPKGKAKDDDFDDDDDEDFDDDEDEDD